MLRIRRYQPQDNEAVKALHYAGLAQLGAEADPYHDDDLNDIEGIYLNNKGDFLVGLLDNEIVAIGAIRKVSATRGEIKRIRVHHAYQNQGYAQTILSKLIELAGELGYEELCLDTMPDNLAAIRVFEKFDFRETHRAKVGGYDLIFYEKRLNHNT